MDDVFLYFLPLREEDVETVEKGEGGWMCEGGCRVASFLRPSCPVVTGGRGRGMR